MKTLTASIALALFFSATFLSAKECPGKEKRSEFCPGKDKRVEFCPGKEKRAEFCPGKEK